MIEQVDCICEDLQQRKDVKTLERFIRVCATATVKTATEGLDDELLTFIAFSQNERSLHIDNFKCETLL